MPDGRGVYLAGVFAFVFDNEGRFLLLEERAEKKKYMFDLPGGTLQPTEEPMAGLRREILEETSLEIAGVSPLCHLKFDQHESGQPILVAFYVARCETSAVKLSVEHTGHRWVSRAEYEEAGYTVSLANEHAFRLLDAYQDFG